MTEEQALLAVALGAPVAGALVGLVAGLLSVGRRLVQGAALVSAVAWAGLLALSPVHLGGFHSGPLVSSAACGAALLLIAAERDSADRGAVFGGGLALFFVQVALAGGDGGGHGG
ncbi:MAG: hypothetical protein LC713_06560, partial [Actinobacteria bacterium]|nr:hypothetical protein [Actinomycetota bacterium]